MELRRTVLALILRHTDVLVTKQCQEFGNLKGLE